MQVRLDFAARSRQTKITLLVGCGQTAKQHPPGCGLTALLTALLIHAPQIKIPHPVKSTWIGDFLKEGGQDFGRIGWHEVVRIHQLPPTRRYLIMGIAFVFIFRRYAGGFEQPGPGALRPPPDKTALQAVFRARLANLPVPTKKCPASRDAEQKMTYSA